MSNADYFLENKNINPLETIQVIEGSVFLKIELKEALFTNKTAIITTDILGTTFMSEAIFENADGTPYTLNLDYFGLERSKEKPLSGPFSKIKKGVALYKLW